MAPARAEWLAATPFTLVLSAGFFGFFAHTGLLLALEARGLRPRRVVGVSAGALAGGLWASGVPAPAIADRLKALRRADFWDPGLPLGGLLKGHKFAALLAELAPVTTPGCEVPLPFTAVAHDLAARRPVALDHAPLGVAIRASCAVPLMFRPVRHGGRLYVDGGVSDRSGLSTVAPGEPTLVHYLPSHSPWRRLHGRHAAAPDASPIRAVLASAGLPRVGPGRLEAGPDALAAARARAEAWLDAPA